MSVPGGIAFRFLSVSFVVVYVIMTLIVLAMQYVKMLVHMAVRNPVLSAVAGWSMSIMVAHFGGAPKSQLPALIFLLMSITLICVIKSKWMKAHLNRVCARS